MRYGAAVETQDRRKSKRYALSAKAEVLLRGRVEGTGSILDISEHGIALLTSAPAEEGDEIVIYAQGFGRFEGKVVRTFDKGVGVCLTLSPAHQVSIRKKIAAALEGVPYLRLLEERSGIRLRYNIETAAMYADRRILCTIIDMSTSGCQLKCNERPPLGESVAIGMLKGRVVRHTANGFAIEFARLARAGQRASGVAA